MKIRILISIPALVLFAALSSAFRQDEHAAIPDPSDYGKLLIECLKKNDTLTYSTKIAFTESERNFFLNQLMADSFVIHLQQTNPERYNRERLNYVLTKEIVKSSIAYKELRDDGITMGINWTNVIYRDTYFEITKSTRDPYITKATISIGIQHDTSYYRIDMNGVVIINGKWRSGGFGEIRQTDKYNKELYDPSKNTASTDTTAVVPAVIEQGKKSKKRGMRLR